MKTTMTRAALLGLCWIGAACAAPVDDEDAETIGESEAALSGRIVRPVPVCGGSYVYKNWECVYRANGTWGWQLVEVYDQTLGCSGAREPAYTGEYACIQENLSACGGGFDDFCFDDHPECDYVVPPGPDSLCTPTKVPDPPWH